MLRKTAARAFAGNDETVAKMPKAAHETRRSVAVGRLFVDLHAALRSGVEQFKQRSWRAPNTSDEEPSQPPGNTSPGAAEETSSLELTDAHSRPQGVEFVLRGPVASLRFLDTMTGAIEVHLGTATEEGLDILAVHPYWGTYRPILKPVGPDRGRSAFCYSSAAELAAYYLERVRGTAPEAN